MGLEIWVVKVVVVQYISVRTVALHKTVVIVIHAPDYIICQSAIERRGSRACLYTRGLAAGGRYILQPNLRDPRFPSPL